MRRAVELDDRLQLIAELGLPADFYDRLLTQTAAMSVAEVKALIASELRPDTEVVEYE